jgi:hypothetical protein
MEAGARPEESDGRETENEAADDPNVQNGPSRRCGPTSASKMEVGSRYPDEADNLFHRAQDTMRGSRCTRCREEPRLGALAICQACRADDLVMGRVS